MKKITSLVIEKKKQRYDALIGTGGIGSGMFIELEGNHTLGREESRGGRILNRRDYCKLHIISHYIAVLLGKNFRVFPIGYVGEDVTGERLSKEMEDAGMDMRFVMKLRNEQTLFSVCFTYPDKSGGNITTNDSACSRVTPATIRQAIPIAKKYGMRTIVMAVPEVPLKARMELIKIGSKYKCFRTASFTSGEMTWVRQNKILKNIDYLAINIHEASLLCGISGETKPEKIVARAFSFLSENYPQIICSITAGKIGSWVKEGEIISNMKPVPVKVASTAGAGDAFMSGMMTGIVCGLSIKDSHMLANLVSSMSVMSPHTINTDINSCSILALTRKHRIKISEELLKVLGG